MPNEKFRKSPVLRNHDLTLFFPIVANEAKRSGCKKIRLNVRHGRVKEFEEYKKCIEIFKSKKMREVSESVFEWDLT